MEILLGKNSGFCSGVRRSIEKANNLLKESEKEIYCLGELIHNDEFLQEMYKKGLKKIDNILEASKESTVIIRAHGVGPEVYEHNEVNIIDATCPFVKRIHEKVVNYTEEGYYIIITGDNKHPEVVGIKGYCQYNSCIVKNKEELPKLDNNNKICIISQTTFSEEEFKKIVVEAKSRYKNNTLKIDNTICSTTRNRQKEACDIASKVQFMIIIGYENSSNTRKLYEISKTKCDNTIQIQNIENIPQEVFAYKKIGIMAGASVPQEKIEEVINFLKSNKNSKVVEVVN